MITCDTNVLIYAVQVLLHKEFKRVPEAAAAALLINQRKRLKLCIPSPVLGEILNGPSNAQETDWAMSLLSRCTFIENSPTINLRGARLRRLLNKGPRSLIDCVIYTTSAAADAATHFTYDRGFSGLLNRIRIPKLYTKQFGRPAPSILDPMEINMKRTNPPSKQRAPSDYDEVSELRAELRHIAKAYRARAWRRAKEAGCRTPMDVVRYLSSIPYAVGLIR